MLDWQWTNDRWRSTIHRVQPPARHQHSINTRRSVAFFHEANDDALITCLPSCCSPDNPAKYPPVTAHAHLMAKLMGPKLNQPSVAMQTVGVRMDKVEQ